MTIPYSMRLAALGLVFIAAAGCDSHESDAGPKRTETRSVGSFDTIDLDGSARLNVIVGDVRSVSVAAPENAIDRITTEVEGNTLLIRTRAKDWVWMNGQPRIEVTVSVPSLKLLKLQGGNDVRLRGFKGGASSIEVQGAAHLKATGELDTLDVDMQGAGFADLSDLTADAANVTVDGVGKVIVRSKNKLDATINGIGSISYIGSPHDVNTRMNGFGSITQLTHEKMERKKRKEQEREWRKQRRHDQDRQDDDDSDAAPAPEVNPDELQPEYDNRPGSKGTQPKKVVDVTEVV